MHDTRGGCLSEMVLAVLNKDGKFIAGVFTPNGLYNSSLPFDNELDAIKDVGDKYLLREDTPERMLALETVLLYMRGVRVLQSMTSNWISLDSLPNRFLFSKS